MDTYSLTGGKTKLNILCDNIQMHNLDLEKRTAKRKVLVQLQKLQNSNKP